MIRCVGGSTRLTGGRRVGGYIQTDTVRFTGFAGAVLFSATGGILGVAMPVRRREESLVLPIGEVLRIVEKLRNGASTGVAYLGVGTTGVCLPEQLGDRTHALLVTAVESPSPAAAAGLRVVQFLIAVGGQPTESVEDLFDALTGRNAGERIVVEVLEADGTLRTIDVEVSLRS
jgi:putative serine protease PepD